MSHDGPSGFRHVATSKFLHAYNTRLFIPWDNPIREDLGRKLGVTLAPDGYAYAFQFLNEVKAIGDEVIQTYPSKDRLTAIQAIESMAQEKKCVTFAKLIDEYNWIEAKRGRKKSE
jgi:hypothetical protein